MRIFRLLIIGLVFTNCATVKNVIDIDLKLITTQLAEVQNSIKSLEKSSNAIDNKFGQLNKVVYDELKQRNIILNQRKNNSQNENELIKLRTEVSNLKEIVNQLEIDIKLINQRQGDFYTKWWATLDSKLQLALNRKLRDNDSRNLPPEETQIKSLEIIELGLNYHSKLKPHNISGTSIEEPLNDIEGLNFMTNLKALGLNNNNLKDLRDISRLLQLEKLEIDNTNISSLNEISELTKIKILTCRNNNLKSLKGVEKMTNLEVLFCQGNPIEDISALIHPKTKKLFIPLKELMISTKNLSSSDLTLLKETFLNRTIDREKKLAYFSF